MSFANHPTECDGYYDFAEVILPAMLDGDGVSEMVTPVEGKTKRTKLDRDIGRGAFALVLGLLTVWNSLGRAHEQVRFNRDVRTILADKCFHCHGADARTREAELRLDFAQTVGVNRGAHEVVTSGKPDESTLYQRIIARDAVVRMPPPTEERQLDAKEIEVLRRWIEQGAVYEDHWAFDPPGRPKLPAVESGAWSRQPIDQFVRKQLDEADIRPSQDADRVTSLRRVTLDLTGLPPNDR